MRWHRRLEVTRIVRILSAVLVAGIAIAAVMLLARRPETPPTSHIQPEASVPGEPTAHADAPVSPPATVAPASAPSRAVTPPGTGAALVARGHAAMTAGDLRGAVDAFREAVAVEPSLESHAALGDLYFRLAASSAAWKHLQAAAELDPSNPDRWISLANAHVLRVDPGEAALALDRARALEPGLRLVRDASGFYVRTTID